MAAAMQMMEMQTKAMDDGCVRSLSMSIESLPAPELSQSMHVCCDRVCMVMQLMYACMSVCLSVGMYVCMYASMHLCTYVHMYVRVYV